MALFGAADRALRGALWGGTKAITRMSARPMLKGMGRATLFTAKHTLRVGAIAGYSGYMAGAMAYKAGSGLINTVTLGRKHLPFFKPNSHGVIAPTPRLYGTAFLGAGAISAGYGATTLNASNKSMYNYDDGAPLHRDALGASGNLVTQGRR